MAIEMRVSQNVRAPSPSIVESVIPALLIYGLLVSLATTTLHSRLYVEGAREICAILFTSALIYGAATRQIALVRPIIAAAIILFIFSYGSLGALGTGSFEIVASDILIGMGVTLACAIGFSSMPVTAINAFSVKLLLVGVILMFIVTCLVGGFNLSPVPAFVHEYSTTVHGSVVNYSQGVSQFYGIGSILATFLAVHSRRHQHKRIYFVVAIAMLLLSLIGGARGDSIAAVIVAFVYLVIHRRFIEVSIGIGGLTAIVKYAGEIAGGLTIVKRLAALEFDLGYRDVLFAKAIGLLSEQPICAFVGCGFGYFQQYYEYDAGVYPHNVVIESVIVFGAPLVILGICLAAGGAKVKTVEQCKQPDALPIVTFYMMLIGLKSGSIIGAWFLLGAIAYYITIVISRISTKNIGAS